MIKKPHIATQEEVRITRERDAAVIEYKDPIVGSVHLTLGPKVSRMTDVEILAAHNIVLRSMERSRFAYDHVAVEIPPGGKQIRYSAHCDQWTPRGDVLRCVISDGGPDYQASIIIDGRELSLDEFGRLLITHAGWGMRIVFVPDDQVHVAPRIRVGTPTRGSKLKKNPFLGRWKITGMELWDSDVLEEFRPAVIEFGGDDFGEMKFCAVQASLDCRFSLRDGLPFVEFSLDGDDDSKEISGRGWAQIEESGNLRGRFNFHFGDESVFTGEKLKRPSRNK